jgi:hypothetical protein
MGSENAPEAHHQDDIQPYVPQIPQDHIDRDEEVSSRPMAFVAHPLIKKL